MVNRTGPPLQQFWTKEKQELLRPHEMSLTAVELDGKTVGKVFASHECTFLVTTDGTAYGFS